MLTLYRREDKGVLPLLEGLVMDESHGEFGWGGECEGRSRTLYRTLAVSDLPRSLAFYHSLLQLRLEATWDAGA